jgi:hypothetical protein
MNLFEREGFSDPVKLLRTQRSECVDMATYLKAVERRYRRSPMLARLGSIASVIEPIDRALGKAEETPIASAFYSGALLGMHVVEQCTPKRLRAKISEVTLGVRPLGNDEDKGQYIHEQAAVVIHDAERGLSAFPDVAQCIEDLEEEVTPDVSCQPFVRRGFGLMLFAIQQADEANARDEMQRGVETGSLDWDAMLAGLQ